jgi:hypothetical protein
MSSERVWGRLRLRGWLAHDASTWRGACCAGAKLSSSNRSTASRRLAGSLSIPPQVASTGKRQPKVLELSRLGSFTLQSVSSRFGDEIDMSNNLLGKNRRGIFDALLPGIMITRSRWWLCLLGTFVLASSVRPPGKAGGAYEPSNPRARARGTWRVSDSLRHFLPSELAPLSPEQRLALANIVNHVVDKRDVEIVASHYDESLAWLGTHYAPFTTVYTHGDPAAAAASLPGVAVVPLELNAGKENHGFLAHIVQR